MNIITQQAQIAYGHNILRNTIVLCCNPALGNQACFHAAKHLLSGIVQFFKSR